MTRLTICIVALALAGSVYAEGWRSLRIDASSDGAFEQSLAQFKDKLTPARRYVFGESLKDIWIAGVEAAQAEQRAYTEADYYRQLDGLGYQEVANLMDPTGQTARRYRAEYDPYVVGDRTRGVFVSNPAPFSSGPSSPTQPLGLGGNQTRGGTPLFGPSLPQ